MKATDYIAGKIDRLPKGYVFTYDDFLGEVNGKEAKQKLLKVEKTTNCNNDWNFRNGCKKTLGNEGELVKDHFSYYEEWNENKINFILNS